MINYNSLWTDLSHAFYGANELIEQAEEDGDHEAVEEIKKIQEELGNLQKRISTLEFRHMK